MKKRLKRLLKKLNSMELPKVPLVPRWLILVGWIGGIAIVVALLAYLLRDQTFALFQTKGEIANRERDLLYFATFLAVLVLLPVYLMLFAFAWRYRAGHRRKYQPKWDSDRKYEAIWWGIPIAIIAVLAAVTWVTSHSLDPYKALASSKKPIHVQVIALEWKWLFIYPEQQVASVNELVIPAGRPVNFSITSDAPMNSFWIPQLGGQIYAMNGMETKLHLIADEPGSYRGMSANISGKGFADMNFMTYAVPDAQFDDWVAKIHSHEDTQDLDWRAFESLTKPATSPVIRYHLHDEYIFGKVLNKYADHGMMNEAMTQTHTEGM